MDISRRHSINNGKEYRCNTNGRGWIFAQVSKSAYPSGCAIDSSQLIVFETKKDRYAQNRINSRDCIKINENVKIFRV